MIYKCSWNILNGLIMDELVPGDEQDRLINKGFQSNGIMDTGNTIYYIKAVDKSRDVAIDKIRKYIQKFMKMCIDEHEIILNNARSDWKKCK